MPNFSSGYISISDLYLAYRKAKADSFFDNTYPCALAFAEYEQELENNLKQLFARIIAKKPDWMNDTGLLGGYSYVPKSIDDSFWDEKDSIHYRAVNPIEDWNRRFDAKGCEKITAKYRLIITATVNLDL